MQTGKCDIGGRRIPRGLKYVGNGRWRARVWNPKLKFSFWIGGYDSLEEAVNAINKKKAEFRESSGDDYTGKKLPFGVRRRSYGRWQAQIIHPILNIRVSLGCYDNPEEASMVVKRAKAEFEDSSRTTRVTVESYGSDFKNDLRNEVYECDKKIGLNIKGVDILKKDECEYLDMTQCVKDGSQLASTGLALDSAALDATMIGEMIEAIKFKGSGYRVPFGVSFTKSEMWDAWATHPLTGAKQSLLSYKTFEAAINAAIKKTVEFDKIYKISRLDSEATDDQEKPEQGCDYGCSSSVSNPENMNLDKMNNTIANVKAFHQTKFKSPTNRMKPNFRRRTTSRNKIRDEFKTFDGLKKSESDYSYGCPASGSGIKSSSDCTTTDTWSCGQPLINARNKLHCDTLYGSSMSAINPDNARGLNICSERETTKANLHITTSSTNFDSAVGLGFIDEYGQLLGEYSMLDDQMGLSLPVEDISAQ